MPDMSLRPGELFAGYTIERELGAGGMGSVYLARHPRLPRYDALKLLRVELCDDPAFVGRFEREADTVAQLDHPNIVAVYDRGSADGQLWISMRFIDGTNAEKALAEYPAGMPPERAVRIVGRVASALDYAHRHHLLHRDVKPANILLAPGPDDDDEAERVFLSDFGVAKAIGAAADRIASLTSTGSVVATLDYASPEQIKGLTLDHRTDVYALGCVLYKLLTGTVPFPGDSIATRVYGHLNGAVRPPSGMVADLPAEFDDVVATAMAKDAADRYPTCRALAQAARAALAGPVTAAPAPAPTGPDLGTTVARRAGGPAGSSTGSSTGVPTGRPDGAPSGQSLSQPSEQPSGRPPGQPSGRPNGGQSPGRPSEPLPDWLSGRVAPVVSSGTIPPPTSGPARSTDRPTHPPAGSRPGPATWPESQEHAASGEHRAVPAGPPGAAPPRRPDRAPPTTGGSSRRLLWVALAAGAVVVIGAVVAALLVSGNIGGTAAPSTGSSTPTVQTSVSMGEQSGESTGGITYGPSPTPVVGTASGPVAGLPHASPLGTQVVVMPQVVDGTGDLYAVDADTAETVARLTDGAGGPQAPVLSPDRGSVVYVQSSAISGTIRTVAVDGSGDRTLWDGRPADCQTYFRPAWNPIDQTRLAVPCVTTKGSFVLSVIDVDGSGTVHATIDTGLAAVTDVSYSPDGSTLTYRGADSVGDAKSALYTQPADGSDRPTRLTDGATADGGPMFSPDGGRIVFTRGAPDGSGSTIMLMNADGSDLRPLTDGSAHDQDPTWSPDGTRIVFRSDRSTGDPNASQFWVMQGNGADPQPLTSEVANGPAAWGRR